jgi:hypothetical protein
VVRRALTPLIVIAALSLVGCKKRFGVGDRVLVEWEGKDYPALIKESQPGSKFKVHYEGYDDVWDEVVPKDRVHGLIDGPVAQPEPPAKVLKKAVQAAKTNVFKINDHVRVEWHGQVYSATVIGIVGPERYRIRYDGYGQEWDETVGLDRILPK